MAGFVEELQRRSVFRVGAAYLVAAWLVLQLTDLVFENLNAPDWVMQAVMLVLALGLPIALIVAWAFELKADGLQRDESLGPAATRNARLFYAAVGVISVVAVGLFLWQYAALSTSDSEPEGNSLTSTNNDESLLAIAVLPFESFTEDREDQYFADGLADTLLHKLAQLRTLTVIARNSSFQFKGQNVDVREIGEKLGVPTVVEGSVQRQGNNIRVIAQLVSTEDGAHWWSGTFDGTFDNIFDLQDEIAGAIAEQLQVTLSDQDRERLYRRGTNNPLAYETLARARASPADYDGAGFDPDNNPKIRLLREVVELDPNYALGWVNLSDYYNGLAFHDTVDSRFEEFVAESKVTARKAIELGPNRSEGYVSLGFAHWRLQEIPAAEEAYRNALAIDPNDSGALGGLGLILVRSNPEDAYRLFSRSREIDPTNTIVYRQLFFTLVVLGRPDEGLVQLEKGLSLDPDFFLLYEDIAGLHAANFGRHDLSAEVLSDLLRRDPDSRAALSGLAEAWHAVRDLERARAWNESLLRLLPGDSAALDMQIQLLQLQGDASSARAIAESLPSQGFARVRRHMRILLLCDAAGEPACAIEHLESLYEFVETFEARSGQAMAGIQALLDFYRGRMGHPDAAAADASLKKAARTFRNFTVLASGSADIDSRRLFLAEILTLQGSKDEAVAELERTLEVDGIVHQAPGDVFPEDSLVLAELRDQPGYSEWLAEFLSRRTAMRERMIAMEAAGQIARTP